MASKLQKNSGKGNARKTNSRKGTVKRATVQKVISAPVIVQEDPRPNMIWPEMYGYTPRLDLFYFLEDSVVVPNFMGQVVPKATRKVIVGDRSKKTEAGFFVGSAHDKLHKMLSKKALKMQEVKAVLGNTYYDICNRRKEVFGRTEDKLFYVIGSKADPTC